MKVKDEVVRLIEIRRLKGTTKDGKDYDFETLTIGDDEFNKIQCSINCTYVPEDVWAACNQHKSAVVEIEFYPQGFNIKARINSLEIQ